MMISKKLFGYLPLKSEILKGVIFSDVANWSSDSFVENVLQVARKIPTVIPQSHFNELEVECRGFAILNLQKEFIGDDNNIESTWLKVSSSSFPHLCQLAVATLTIFHGNADVECTNSLIGNQNLSDKKNDSV